MHHYYRLSVFSIFINQAPNIIKISQILKGKYENLMFLKRPQMQYQGKQKQQTKIKYT